MLAISTVHPEVLMWRTIAYCMVQWLVPRYPCLKFTLVHSPMCTFAAVVTGIPVYIILYTYNHYSYVCLPSDTLTEEEQLELQQRESSLFQFWSCIRHVIKATPSGSMLRDTAQLELTVTQSAVPSSEEEKVNPISEGHQKSPGGGSMHISFAELFLPIYSQAGTLSE